MRYPGIKESGKIGEMRSCNFNVYLFLICSPQCVVTEGATGLSDGGSLRESSQCS